MRYELTLVAAQEGCAGITRLTADGTPPAKGDFVYYCQQKYTVTRVYRWFKEAKFHEGRDVVEDNIEVVAADDVQLERYRQAAATQGTSVREPETKG